MRFANPINNTFIKLFISYLAITLIITLILGFTLFSFFSEKYNEQVIKMNNILLSQQKDTIQSSILRKVENLYVSLATLNTNPYLSDFTYFNSHPVDGRNAALYEDSQYLKSTLLANESIINNIHIYIPYNNLIISTSWGVQFLNDSQIYSHTPADWFTEVYHPSKAGKWLDTRPMKNIFNTTDTSFYTSYIRSFPLFATNVDNPSTIVFDINETYISNILREFSSSPNTESFIVNRSGKAIFSTNKKELNIDLSSKEYIRKILGETDSSDNFITEIDGKRCMVSSSKINSTGWTVIVYTPVGDYFKQSSIIKQSIISFCTLAAVVGILLTLVFSKRIYNPLKSLIFFIKMQLTEASGISSDVPSDRSNEYTIIKNAFKKLSYKVTELENTIVENRPIIKQNLMMSLLNNSVPSREDLAEQIKLSGVSFPHANYVCMIADIGNDILRSMEMKDRYYSFYITSNEIEKMSDENESLYPVILNRTRIALIINSKEAADAGLIDIASRISSFMESNFRIQAYFSASTWASDPLEVSNAYDEAVRAMKYRFFQPEKQLISYKDIAACESGNKKIVFNSSEYFTQALNVQDMEAVISCLKKTEAGLSQNDCSAEYRRKKLFDIIDTFYKYCSNLKLDMKLSLANIDTYLENIADINEFNNLVAENTRSLFKLIDERNSYKNIETIRKVKEYICSNLGYQLSLESASAHVNLTPKYLSKIFKEITGVNFQEYVTETKMEKSRQLLLHSELNLEQISTRVGYSSPAYFIKQFKKLYGDTPYSYRKSSGIKENIENFETFKIFDTL